MTFSMFLGDEYAVIWHPDFVPNTPNDAPYEYDSQMPMLRVVDRPVNRSDIQDTVLNISEQCCVGKLCSLHLANTDLYGVHHPKTLDIAAHISKELDAPKTGHHSITPEQIIKLQEELGDKRPDYFDKPYYKPYPSKHILGKIFLQSRSARFLFVVAFQDNYFVHHFVSNPIGMRFKLHRKRSLQHLLILCSFTIPIVIICQLWKNSRRSIVKPLWTSCMSIDFRRMLIYSVDSIRRLHNTKLQ